MANEPKRRKVTLECLHEFWFMPPVPSPGQLIYCRNCKEYQPVEGEFSREFETLYDGWSSRPTGKTLVITCLYNGYACGYKSRVRSYSEGEMRIFRHQLNEHGHLKGQGRIEIGKAQKLPPNSKPPF